LARIQCTAALVQAARKGDADALAGGQSLQNIGGHEGDSETLNAKR